MCTLGPASNTAEKVGDLIDAGMNVARLNFSHGDHAGHRKMVSLIREEARKRNKAVAILADLQGPKIRVGRFEHGEVELTAGQTFRITVDQDVVGNGEVVSTSYVNLISDVKVGDRMLLDDGYLALTVTNVSDKEVETIVVAGGTLKNNKGINLPGVDVSAPALTEKDKKDLVFAMTLGVEYFALSFVRSAEDVRIAQKMATTPDYRIPVIAKIEKPEALEHLESIIKVADGVMVARGDLGVELGPEKVPIAQKEITRLANENGKICITATQMLESMIHHPRPTRAEASDVANAVFDGTDALMLSGETAAGKYPVECVRTMSKIIKEAETSTTFKAVPWTVDMQVSANAVATGAVTAADSMGIGLIAVVTDSGGAARLTSQYRPKARLIALTPSEITYRRLAMYWGVEPELIDPCSTTEELLELVEETVISREYAESGEDAVITMALPVGAGLTTNTIKIHKIG